MAVFKVVNEGYSKQGDITRLIHYMMNEKKMEHGYYGNFSLYYDGNAQLIEKQFEMIRKMTNKEELGRHAYHFILSFDSYYESHIKALDAKKIAEHVWGMLLQPYQFFYVVHEEPQIHIHFVINAVGIDGKVFEDKREVYNDMAAELYWCHPKWKIKYMLVYG